MAPGCMVVGFFFFYYYHSPSRAAPLHDQDIEKIRATSASAAYGREFAV